MIVIVNMKRTTNTVFSLMFGIFLLIDVTLSSSGGDDDSAEQLHRIMENQMRCLGVEVDLSSMLDENTTDEYSFEITTTTTTTRAMSLGKSAHCPREFDGILCWEETLAGQNAYQQCPEWFIGFQNKKERAKRFCRPDGTWYRKPNSNNSYTDYMPCIEDLDAKLLANHLPILKLIAKLGSYLSMTSLILAIILLSSFKRLHCSRNALHINLFSSFLMFSVLQLIKETFWIKSVGFPKDLIREHMSLNRYIMNPNISHWECKTLMALYRYAESSNHATVFSEALYLNALLSVSTFNDHDHFKFYIAIGWVGPLIWIIPFIIVMALYHEYNSCWNSETGFSFFYVVPQVLLIFLNFALFINTLRVLKNKLRKSNLADANNSKRYKKLAKSTLLCGFSFSIYYIAFSVWQPFVRGKLPVILDLIRLYFEIICGSFQGLAISCIYCFFNSEVQTEILTQIERKLISRNPNMRRFSQAPNMRDRISSVSLRSHRSTNATKVNNNSNIISNSNSNSKNNSLTKNNKNHKNNNNANNNLKLPNSNWDLQLSQSSPNSTANGAVIYTSSNNNGTVTDSLLMQQNQPLKQSESKTTSNWSKIANLLRKKNQNANNKPSFSTTSTTANSTCPNRSELLFMQKSSLDLEKNATDENNNNATTNNIDNDNQIKTPTTITTIAEYNIHSEGEKTLPSPVEAKLCNGGQKVAEQQLQRSASECVNGDDVEEEETKLVDDETTKKKPSIEIKSAMKTTTQNSNDCKSPKSPKSVVSFSFSKNNGTFDKSDPNELKNLLPKNE